MPGNRCAARFGSRLLAVVNRVRSKPPPMWLVHRVVNPLMRRLLPTRVGQVLPGVAVLRFRGRRTGAAYAVPVGIYDHEGAQVVFSDAPWAANFRGGAPLEIIRRGHTTAAYGELVHDPHYVGPAIRAVLRTGTSKTMLGVAIERGHLPTDDELAAVRNAVVIRESGSD